MSSNQENAKLEWPLFPTPSISLLQVTGYEIYNSTPYYVIVICMAGGFRWSVLKSYDEIVLLNKHLVENYALDKGLFPQRKMFGSNKKESITEIQSRLGLYFSALLLRFPLPPLSLLRFLEYKFSDILSITETLSALFFEKGDEFLQTNSMVAFSPLQFHCICKRMILPIVSEHKDMRFDFGHLLEFLQHLQKVKLCPPSRELFPLSPLVDLTFDLSVMKSLDTLVLNAVDLSLIHGMGNIPSQLVTIGVHHALTSLRDILKHTCLGVDQTGVVEGGYVQWSCLRVMDLSYNTVTSIDTSLALCPNLEELNLSNNKIKDIDNLLDLPHLRILDLSHNELVSISDLHYRLGNITTLCLANNSLSCLSGVEKCYSIVCLDIQNNMIAKIGEIGRLASLPVLEQLMVKGNSFTYSPSFRQQVFSLLPNTARQVYLDGKPPSKDELDVSASISIGEKEGFNKKHKKSSTRKVDIGTESQEVTSEHKAAVPPLSAGARRHMEQMRREGGENWLKMLNQQQNASPGKPTRKKHKHRKGELFSPTESIQPVSTDTPSSGLPSSHLQTILDGRDCSSPWSCSATVLQYNGNFRQLSHRSIEQLLTDSSCDTCLLEVDTQIGRIIEDFAVAGGSGGNRRTRDLTFLRDVRCHEGANLAIAIELTALMSHTTWIVYCVRDYPSLADLYVLLKKKLHSSNTAQPPSPALLAKQMSAANEDDEEGSEGEDSEDFPTLQQKTDPPTNATIKRLATPPLPLTENTYDATEELPGTTELDVPGSLAQSPTIPLTLEYLVRKRPTSARSTTEKPGLDSDQLCRYFANHVAREKGEMLMYILWCGFCLPSSFPYELQGVFLVSNLSFYLLEITEQSEERGTWDGEDLLPLTVVISEQLDHLSRVILTGVVDQSVYVELHDKSPVGSFIVFPPSFELRSQLFEQFKAALDASSLHYTVMETLKAKQSLGLSGILFVTPDDFSMKRYKQWLSVAKTKVRLANFLATQRNKSLLGLYDVELKQGVRELAETIDIVNQLIVCSVSNDILPGNNGGSHLQPLVLVLTNTHLWLCEEAFISGPTLRFTKAKHTFSPLSIIRMLPLKDVKQVNICDTLQSVSTQDDMLYQVSLVFPSSVWYLCLHDLRYFNGFLNSLKSMWSNIHGQDLDIVRTKTEIKSFPKPRSVYLSISSQFQSRGKMKIYSPLFFKQLPLLQFASLPHWSKLEMFKEHVAQANFMNRDERPLCIFLAHSQPHLEKRLEVEVFVVVSNYAIYLLSDTDGIRTWLDAGGVSSFARMSLLNSQDNTHLQCFYQLWLSDLTRVHLGPLLLSFRIHDGKSNSFIDIKTNSVQSTSMMVSALASTVGFKEKKPEKDVENLLQEFVDITDDPFGENTPVDPHIHIAQFAAKRSAVDLILPTDVQLADVKLHLVESHPDVARGSSIKKCSESIQILFPAVMLLAEQIRVRDSLHVHYRPHLLLLTNFGLFVCGNSLNPDITPTLLVLGSSQLVVKRWIRIDDIQRVQVAEDPHYHTPQLFLHTRPQTDDSSINQVCLIPYTFVLADSFATCLAMMWEERMGQALPIEYIH